MLAALLLVIGCGVRAQPADDPVEKGVAELLSSIDPAKQRRTPIRLFDDLFFVGIDWVSAYLLSTRDGLVLVDSLYGEYVDHLVGGVAKLGFEITDVRYILVTHAHFDHSGGAKRLQELSGARVGMTEQDWILHEESVRAGRRFAEPLARDLVLRDGERLQVGDTTIEIFVTPGHTPGVLSLRFPVHDGEKTHIAFTFGGVGLNFEGVERTEMYLASVDRLRALEGIEVNVTNHPSMGRIFERATLLVEREPGAPHPFVDANGFRDWLADLRLAAETKLVEERARRRTNP
jgi:metallo-beta-lactamase class B